MTATALHPHRALTAIGPCAVEGCTNSARVLLRIVPGPGPATQRVGLRVGNALVCARHARQTTLGAALYGARAESTDPAPTAG